MDDKNSVGAHMTQADGDPAQSAITQWRQNMREQAQAYFDGLRQQGLAPVQRYALRGRTFIDVDIEGRRFKGQVRKGPQIVAGDGECLLTCASISFGADFLDPEGPAHWAISKYRTQQRIPLDGLSPEGLRALACEFGLLIHGDGNPAAEAVLASECFLLSTAWSGLRAWCQSNPTVARKQLREQADLLRRAVLPQGRPKRRSRYRSIYDFEYLVGS